MRPTLTDISSAARVSPATVDRVLHGHAGVAGRTRAIVLQAARRLGYLADLPDAPAPRVFHLVLPQTRNAYFREVIGHARALTPPHVSLETLSLLAAHPDLDGLYNAGGGTVGIGAALAEAGRRDVILVAHEATGENRALLLDGTLDAVIDQSAREELHEVFASLTAAARGQGHVPPPLRPVLITRENLP